MSLCLIIILAISGCTNQNAPADTTNPLECTKLYDGTWKGQISDSGVIWETTMQNGVPETTHNPFIAQYDLEFTMHCANLNAGENGGTDGWGFEITHVKASHPLFDCADGCVPIGSQLYLLANGTGAFTIGFPNGASTGFYNFDDYIQASPDGKTITVFYHGGEGTADNIGISPDADYLVETYNCQQYGGKTRAYCVVEYTNPNTMTLTKVS